MVSTAEKTAAPAPPGTRSRAVGLRGAIVCAVGVLALDLPLWALIATVIVEAGVSALHRPIHMALLPGVARTPEQLVGANVGSSAAGSALPPSRIREPGRVITAIRVVARISPERRQFGRSRNESPPICM